LIQTKSAHFKPIYCKTFVPQKILFHSLYINKVIFEKDWRDHPSSPRILRDFDIPYCYYDYVEAWSRFFLYQTPKFDHSWFIILVEFFPFGFPGGGCTLDLSQKFSPLN
jgi:hypothetical protein